MTPKVMTPDQILIQMKSQFEKGTHLLTPDQLLSKATLNQLKKILQQLNKPTPKPQDTLIFKQKMIGLLLMFLQNNKTTQQDKISIMELLQKQIISSKHNSILFNKLYNFLVVDDQNVATQASKAIDALIKQINQKLLVTQGAVPLDLKQHYIKLFEFLKQKTQFLLKLKDYVKDPQFKPYKRQPFDQNKDRDRQRDKKDIVFKNSKSLKFINQVPHLFIHLMAYAQLDGKIGDQDKKIKQLIKQSIDNIIKSLRQTPYFDFYNQFNFQFNNQLFGVMTKLLQFLFITIRNQKQDRTRQTNKSNQNLRKHINQQIQFIKIPEVIKNFIYLLKNCSEDFQLNRYQIVNRLKLLLCSLDKGKLGRTDAIDILGQLLNQQTIYGRKKLLGDYSKNAICSYWIQIIKSPVLLHNVFYPNYLSIRNVAQSGITDQNSPQITNCFINIQKLLQQILKAMFDNIIYQPVQQKCIQLLNVIVQQLFPQNGDQMSDLTILTSCPIAKKVHQNKLKILVKILQAASLKFQSIRNIFEEIDLYLNKKLGRKVMKEDLPELAKLKHIQLNTLDISVAETQNFNQKVVDLIENYDENIDNSLLTAIAIPSKFLTIYQQDDQLCFNSHPIKATNFTHFMKQVKTKLIQKTIHLCHRLVKTFLTQNIQSYTPQQSQALKTIYFVMPNKKALTQQQCNILSTILKNGLRIFQILHNYDLHADQQTNKKGHLKNFMLIFAQIHDPVNFRDIFEPNMEQFFRNLVKYAKFCADYCLQFVLIQPFCANGNRQQLFNKNIVQLLIYNLILRLESTSDILDPFRQFYGYKQQYFSLLQKLIRFPFRCLSRYPEDSFIRNYFRQIILILIKKAHTSRFCLDYLHLMRTLFKNILFNCSRDNASPLFSQFYAICSKTSHNSLPLTNPHSIFINVNVLQNFMKLYQTGIPQLADIVTQLIIMLPLKSKHIIHFAKQGYIVKPLLHCLYSMSDNNYTLRTLKTLQLIISHSNAQQINSFLDGVKDKLIDRLYHMVSQCKVNDLKLVKITNQLSPLSLKLLAKLGALSRGKQLPIQMKTKDEQDREIKLHQLQLVFTQVKTTRVFTLEMTDAIQYAIEIFHKILNTFYQPIVFITMDMIQQCFALLKEVLPLTLVKMHPLSQRIISIFCKILSLSSKYLTISPSILALIRAQVQRIIKQQSQNIRNQLMSFGLNDYCKFFIKSLVTNLSQRVLITRQDNYIKQISQQPRRFIWELICSMLTVTDKTNISDSIYQHIIRMLISQIIMIKNPNHIDINSFQNQYNHTLPYKNAALNCLNDIIDTASPAVLDQTKGDIIQAIFIVVTTLPDILNLKVMQHPSTIANKIFTHMLKDQKQFLRSLQTQQGDRIFSSILENLVSYSQQAHNIAKSFLYKIMNETELNLVEILYGGVKWQQIYDKSSPYTKYQSKYSLDNLTSGKQIKKCPIVSLAKNLVKISFNVNQQNLKNSPRMIKMLSNTFLTYQLLINIKYKEKTYHAFSILAGKNTQSNQFTQSLASFDKNFQNVLKVAQTIIQINSNIYGNYTKIIIQLVPTTTTPPPGPSTTTITPNCPCPCKPANQRPRDIPRGPLPTGTVVPSGTSSVPAFNINPNTFIDDEEYGLNVEDFDMEIKSWSQLISSILKFQKSVLFNDTIFTISKTLQKNKIQKSPIIQKRIKIIFTMFQLIGRVQRSVRQTAYQCIKQLLSRQDHPKDLIQNDQKLKFILKPVLISLQLQFKKFTPSFLHMFRKILKLLTQCFNITLIQKLVDKLRQMDKNRQPDNTLTTTRNFQQSIKYPNFSQITCQVKCIANFLGLFQHLAYAFHSHRSNNYAINTLILIFKYIVSISEFFVPKLGKHTATTNIKTVLAKVLNTMCQKISGQNIFNQGNQRQLDFQHFLQIIKMDDSYPLRQKMTRDTAYIDRAFVQFSSKTTNKKDFLTFLQIIKQLATRNNKWLKDMTPLADKLLKQLNQAIANRQKRYQQRQIQQIGQKNQIVLLAKILLQYVKQNKQELHYLFGLVNLFKLRTTFDIHFIRIYLKYQLYQNITPETRRRLFIEYFRMYRQPIKQHDTDKILAISQHIIYQFILIQLQMQPEQRSILVKDTEIIKQIVDTIKMNLSQKYLHSRNPNAFRQAIEILQISNLMMRALKNLLSDDDRSNMLCVVWGLLRIQDKIIRNYAFVWTASYISYFDGLGQSKALGLYLILIRALQSVQHGDYQIGVLIRKALNILIPYWDAKSRDNPPQQGGQNGNSWIEMSLRAVHDQSNQPTRLVRFWQIVVKNHQIFNKFKQSKFQTQMVNSMQWLMIGNNPTSSNPYVKKIASDMSFIYIEWKFKQVKNKMKGVTTLSDKIRVLDDTFNQKAAQICLNFFIKVALNNCNDKDDKQIMRRSLYLLKKTLILWPNTKKKFQNIKAIINKQKNSNTQGTQGTQSPTRFHYALLNTINILLLYQTDDKLLPQLTTIFKLMQLGQITPPRIPTNGPTNHTQSPNTNNSIFTMNNAYLMHLLCAIVKRLLKVAAANPSQDQSIKLLQQLHAYIKQGFDLYVLATTNKNRVGNTQQTQQPAIRPPGPKKIEIEVAISLLKIMFDTNPEYTSYHLNNIKQVASSHKKAFEKGFEQSKRVNSTNRVYQPPPLTQGTFKQMLNKDLQINVNLVKQDALLMAEQNYQKQIIKCYVAKRPQFVILLRILAAKINSNNPQQQGNILDILLTIYEKIPDPQLKVQVINILKCLFIGNTAFPNSIVPQRYKSIPIIDYDQKKIFYMLLQDNKKFNAHFQKRKIKPSDPNYNLNQVLYQEITAKVYFDFLCLYILNLKIITPEYLEKIRIFVLYALKIASSELIDQIFNILDERYYTRNRAGMFLALFQDYKDLYCAQQQLQGDQIMLFFAMYLYKKIQIKCTLDLYSYKQQMNNGNATKFENFYISLIKSDQQSNHHLQMIIKLLKISIALSDQSNPKLSMIIKDYLLTGSYNVQQGQILLKIIQDYQCLSQIQMFAVNTQIVNWGMISKFCDQSKKQSSKTAMDSVCRMYGDQDLICGFRMGITRSPQLQQSMCNLQQRRYIDSLKNIQQYKNTCAKRARAQRSMSELPDLVDILMDGPLGEPTPPKIVEIYRYEKQMDQVYMDDVVKECYKNLNKWEIILEKSKSDLQTKIDYLFHCGSNKQKLTQIIQQIQQSIPNPTQFGFYYGKSVLHFLDSGPSPNKDLSAALFCSLVEWLCYPKNARCQQNKILGKIQSLLELDQAEKIKDQSNPPTQEHRDGLEILTKVVQNVYTNVNYWRERIPDKNQDLTVWDAILGQRNMLYQNIKKKNISLYENVISTTANISTSSFSKPDKLFIPYTDIQWNKLKLQQQQRYYNIFSGDKTNTSQLYLDENFLKQKQKYFQLVYHQKDHQKALKLLEDVNNYKDQQLEKIQRAQRLRLKAKLYKQRGAYHMANQIYFEAVSLSDHQLLTVWRDWMLMSIQAYNTTSDPIWAYSAISTLPYTLRHKTYKTKLLLAPIFRMIKKLQNDLTVRNILDSFVRHHLLPMKAMLHWLPQIILLATLQPQLLDPTNQKSGPMIQILDKLCIYSFSTIFFLIKPFLFNLDDPISQVAKQMIFKKMKYSGYHLATKLQKFSQLIHLIHKDQKISVMSLGEFYQTFTEISMPLVDSEIPSKAPYIIQICENLQNQIMNNKQGKIITLLGSDGKQYQYRLEFLQKLQSHGIFQDLLNSQSVQTFNQYLKLDKQTSRRGIKVLQLKKIYLKEDLTIVRSNIYSLSLLDILNDYLKTTSYSPQYPQSDKNFLKLPKNQINKSINKHMKQIVPNTVFKNFIQKKAYNYDEYISFRKAFSYQYGAIMAINYIMGIQAHLSNYVIQLRTGSILLNDFHLKPNPKKLSPYSVRLSRNILTFLTKTHINSGVLPSIISTANSFLNQSLAMSQYLDCLNQDHPYSIPQKIDFNTRMNQLKSNFGKTRKILELAEKIGEQDDTPYQFKYWF